MADDLSIHVVTLSGEEQDVALADLLKTLPRNRTLMLRYSTSDNKVVANFGGDNAASGDDTALAIAAAYSAFLKGVQIENPQRKRDPSYVAPNLTRKPLAGHTIPFGSLPSHLKKKVKT